MNRIHVNDRKDGFVRGGKPFFLMADTVWSIFSNTPVDEWEDYLDYRSQQGFNALQISVLPILHDTSETGVGLLPFEAGEDGGWNFYAVNEAYFERAESLIRMAAERGFVPVLVLLWGCYVPGNWMSELKTSLTMPFDAVKPYVDYVVERFRAYKPMYFLSGDTNFYTEEGVEFYKEAGAALKAADPEALAALHICGLLKELPDSMVQSDLIDYYIYQSGHGLDDQSQTYKLAEHFLQYPVKRPVFNSEPCYEGHGHGGRYGRFGAYDIRRAFWSSVLGGGKAGFTYGTHGLFSWHKRGAAFTNEGWSKIPFPWHVALQMQGGWDVSFCKWLFEEYGLYELEPANERLLIPYEDIRLAITPGEDTLVCYIPSSSEVRIRFDAKGYRATLFELETKRIVRPTIQVQDGVTIIGMHDFASDAVVFLQR